MEKSKFKILLQLFFDYFKVGLFTFGGGLSMIPLIERTFVEKRQLITKDELLSIISIAESTPGVIAVNIATYLGYKVRGVLGSIISTIAVILPSLIIISIISFFYEQYMEIVQGITEAAGELNSPVILQVSAGARKYANPKYLKHLVEAAIENYPNIPIALHLDHGDSFEICKSCIDDGFSSVMIDGSKLDFEENIKVTKMVCDYAHDVKARGRYITVEGELGKLAGIEDAVNVKDEDAQFTNPDEVEEFVKRTGVDSLAIAIGTSHGAYKFKPGQKPRLRLDILER